MFYLPRLNSHIGMACGFDELRALLNVNVTNEKLSAHAKINMCNKMAKILLLSSKDDTVYSYVFMYIQFNVE